MTITRCHLTILAVVALIVAACGDGGTTTTTSTTAAPPAVTTAAPPVTQVETTTTLAPDTTTTSAVTTTTAAPTTTEAAEPVMVEVFFSVGDGSDCAEVAAFSRQVAEGADPVATAFAELVAGPSADEVAAGAGSFFTSATADAVLAVSVVDGVLTVDLFDYRLELSNASSSCGSASLLGSLNATAFQFDEVEVARYTILGSCNVFYEWLQRECQDQTRDGPVFVDLDTNAQASGSGCTPGPGALPDGRWFGYVADAAADEVQFDLACWFTGGAAADAASEDGDESPPPNDYYIRNMSSDLRTLPVADTVAVLQLASTGGAELVAVGYDEWVSGWSDRPFQPGVWLTVVGGAVSAVEEQYQP